MDGKSHVMQDWELRESAGIRAGSSCEVRGKTRRVWPTLWNGGNPGLIVQQCLLVLRQLLGKECVAYIPFPSPRLCFSDANTHCQHCEVKRLLYEEAAY